MSDEAEIGGLETHFAIEGMVAVRAVPVHPEHEEMRRPAIGIRLHTAVRVAAALVKQRIANLHGNCRVRIGAEIPGQGIKDLSAIARNLDVPDHAVAVVERQRETVLARGTIGVDEAHVAFAVDPKIAVAGQEFAAEKLAQYRRQTPKEETHRLPGIAIDFVGWPPKHGRMFGRSAQS